MWVRAGLGMDLPPHGSRHGSAGWTWGGISGPTDTCPDLAHCHPSGSKEAKPHGLTKEHVGIIDFAMGGSRKFVKGINSIKRVNKPTGPDRIRQDSLVK